ncbi:MAG: aldehyde dehydrogenase, partial [Gammaproteobacteria bacterium]|nr:aldehyde dehydrogenase [Gammaproteobacteria bacterium]
AIVFCDGDKNAARDVQQQAAENLKRVIDRRDGNWLKDSAASPYLIADTMETKTTWHPIGS